MSVGKRAAHGRTTSSVEPDMLARRLSPWRVAMAVIVLAGVSFGASVIARRNLSSASAPAATFYAPYVDVTATPTYDFQVRTMDPARQILLGFVVADAPSSCQPSWGGYYTFHEAATQINLDLRITEYESIGGQVGVSFGGQANTPLESACTSVGSLEAAYHAVLRRYHATSLDFDIEGSALNDAAATQRRAKALRELLGTLPRSQVPRIWLTLPVSTSGLDAAALAQVTSLLAAHVPISGVNVMAMNFARAIPDMATAAESALNASAAQVEKLGAQYDVSLSGVSLWSHMGLTVMAGQNNSVGESLSTSQAASLAAFARRQHLGRLSIWSLNRDAACGTSGLEQGILSDSCSGVAQRALQFSSTFAHLGGRMSNAPVLATHPLVIDANPADAPYPFWQPTGIYVQGYKVARSGYIYQAQWYTTGIDPAAPVSAGTPSPWVLIGPILTGSTAPTTTTLPPGTDASWTATGVYRAGKIVLYQGLPYVAKWYNVGSTPSAAILDPSASPWRALYTVAGEPAG